MAWGRSRWSPWCSASPSRSSGGPCSPARWGASSPLYRLGRPDAARADNPVARSWTLAKEFLGHTRMSRLKVVAAAHWFTALAFIILFATLVNAFLQLVQPDYRLPVIGHFPPFEWVVELFAWGGLVGILVLDRGAPEGAPALGGRASTDAVHASSAPPSGRRTTSRRRSSS